MAALHYLIYLASVVCFILVIVKMFQTGDTGLGIACLVLLILCGLGVIVAFIMGWVRVNKYGVRKIMLLWTAIVVIGIILNIVAPSSFIAFPR